MKNYLQNHYNLNNIQKYWEEIIELEDVTIIKKHYFNWCQRKLTTNSKLNKSKSLRIITSGYYKIVIEYV